MGDRVGLNKTYGICMGLNKTYDEYAGLNKTHRPSDAVMIIIIAEHHRYKNRKSSDTKAMTQLNAD